MILHPHPEVSWVHWSVHPSTVAGIAALGALYAWRARRRLPGATDSPSSGQIAAFGGGLLALFAALNGPLHDLSDLYLFSAHMTQHLVLTMLVTPLLLVGTPGWMLAPALRSRAVAAVARRVTSPFFAFAAFNVTLAVWHLPPMYNRAMASHPVHIVQHLCFLVASTLMWWPLLSPMRELPRLSYPKQMLYTVLMVLPMTLISIYITYAETPLFPAYGHAPFMFGLSPLEDQRLGGLIMWIPGGLIFMGVMTVIFFRWAAHEADTADDSPMHWRPSR